MKNRNLKFVKLGILATAVSACMITGCGENTLPTPENDKTAVVDDASNDTNNDISESDESTPERLETTSMEKSNVPEDVINTTENENEIDATENLIGMTEDEKKEFEEAKNDPENTSCAYYHQDQMPKPTDYGVTVTCLDDIPNLSMYKWDFDKHPIWYGYTDKGYQCVYDPTTDLTYYPSMQDPTGMLFGRDKETTAIWNYIEKMGYDNCFQITYDEAVELFGKPDMKTMSTSDWGCSDYEEKLVNK